MGWVKCRLVFTVGLDHVESPLLLAIPTLRLAISHVNCRLQRGFHRAHAKLKGDFTLDLSAVKAIARGDVKK